MDFWSWHYSFGIKFYLHTYKNSLFSVVQYFSLPLLVRSLFAPWKKLIITEKKKGFNLTEALNTASFNFVSRIVGFFVRLILLITGSLFLLFMTIAGGLGLLLWYVFPFLSYSVFENYKKNPDVVAGHMRNHLLHNPKQALEFLFKEPAGEFIASHVGISKDVLIEHADISAVHVTESDEFHSLTEIITMLLSKGVWSDTFFVDNNVRAEDLLTAAKWWDMRSAKNSNVKFESPKVKAGIGKDLLVGYTPTLDKYGSDIEETAERYQLIGRSKIVNRMERALSSGISVILTGAPGVGKSTVVLEFAKRATYGQLGPQMAYRRIVEVDLNAISSEYSDLNQKKKLISDILSESASAGNLILVFRDLHRYTNKTVDGADYTDIFEKYLERKDLLIIAISSLSEYERYLAANSRLRKFFETVEVVEPSAEQAMDILVESADQQEMKHNVIVTTPTLRRIITGSAQYITDVPFPEKALELLSAVMAYNTQNDRKNVIDFTVAEKVLSERTGVPMAALSDSRKKQLSTIEEDISKRLIDQDDAVNLIAKIIRSKSAGVINSTRPIGSFLFLGPTGVGKTETAKVLARVYFGSERSILRFDMAEFAGSEGIERLIGTQRDNRPGVLTNAIKNNPASLLLLDEFEKAPPAIYNLFLRMLDEGKITDALGNSINCSNLFIIATSNAGAGYIRELVNAGDTDKLQQKVTDYVMKEGLFSPEFINRFDGVVVYKPLSREAIVEIAGILLTELAENLHVAKNIAMRFSREAVEKIAREGFQPEFGARPMRRLIDLQIGDLVGKAILEGELQSGDRISILPAEGVGAYTFEKN